MKILLIVVALIASSVLLWSSTQALAQQSVTSTSTVVAQQSVTSTSTAVAQQSVTTATTTVPCPVSSPTARCVAAPEEGTAPMYLLLAMLFCGGAFLLRNRKQLRG